MNKNTSNSDKVKLMIFLLPLALLISIQFFLDFFLWERDLDPKEWALKIKRSRAKKKGCYFNARPR